MDSVTLSGADTVAREALRTAPRATTGEPEAQGEENSWLNVELASIAEIDLAWSARTVPSPTPVLPTDRSDRRSTPP
ncbi:hypothetical protein DI272_34425 [Streptomyces sp. Act143]|nr:hypothetical protein DI272_34425 [Streptomyces sp. Act143]